MSFEEQQQHYSFSILVFKYQSLQLTYLGGDAEISNNSMLALIDFPELTFTQGYFTVHANQALTLLNLPQLTYIDTNFSIFRNPALTFVVMSQLQHASFLYICENGPIFPDPSMYIPTNLHSQPNACSLAVANTTCPTSPSTCL